MKEFDFDELDKAVNSLMGGAGKPATEPSQVATSAPGSPVMEATPTPAPTAPTPPLPSANVVEDTSPDPVQAPVPPAPPISIPPRQSGRFMDVVHPSSDMKTASPAPSREGLTLQPTSRPSEVTASTRPVIDVMAPVSSKPASEPAAPAPVEATTDLPEEPTSTEPWVSPFLPDTQVEKRPLGGAPTAPPTPDLSQAMATELSGSAAPEPTPAEKDTPSQLEVISANEPDEKSESETPKEVEQPDVKANQLDDKQLAPTSEPAPLPAELNSDLVAIESGQLQAASEIEHTSSADPTATIKSTSSIASHAMSTASIPQQYSEQPSTGDESHTPIYDNESAHQPLKHPAKKKSGWMLVVFIVIILVIGGALGAAAYFFGLI